MSRLDEIQARLAAATPGPWAWRNTTEPYLMGVRTRIVMAFRRMGTQGAQPQFRDEHGLLVDAGKENINDFPDASLIAHAPADLAALVAVVKAVRDIHQPRAVYANEAHCKRQLHDADHSLGRHVEDRTGFWVCLDMPVTDECQTCTDENGATADYPCPTAKALDPMCGAS